MSDKLPLKLAFHNLDHTLQVVNGVREIGFQSALSDEELETVETAAWLHDTGYLYIYNGHEAESVLIADRFLSERDISPKKIKQIVECIAATKYPQKPESLVQQVLCDADFYHLSLSNYPEIAGRLRNEWAYYLNKTFTDGEWNRENCKMLSGHSYFTDYGRGRLEELKSINLEKIESYCK